MKNILALITISFLAASAAHSAEYRCFSKDLKTTVAHLEFSEAGEFKYGQVWLHGKEYPIKTFADSTTHAPDDNQVVVEQYDYYADKGFHIDAGARDYSISVGMHPNYPDTKMVASVAYWSKKPMDLTMMVCTFYPDTVPSDSEGM